MAAGLVEGRLSVLPPADQPLRGSGRPGVRPAARDRHGTRRQAGEGDFKVQAYNFRVHLSKGEDRIPFPRPPGYDPGRYALLARFLNFDPEVNWTLNYTVKPMTDGPVQMRTGDSNNAGSFSTDYVGGNYRWPDGTYTPGSFAEAAAAPPRPAGAAAGAL